MSRSSPNQTASRQMNAGAVAKTSPASSRTDERGDARGWPWLAAPAGKLAQAAVFGLVFGFLLQKGGVAKFDILIGVLLLENFVVIEVMVSAIVVGMIGVAILQQAGVLERKIKDAVLGSNIIGGLIFGIGFGLLAYCPGTNAAALGQGNLDALLGVAGMIIGSYVFALTSGGLQRTVGAWGRLGKRTVADLARLSPGVFALIAVPVLVGVLALLEYLSAR